MYPIDAGVSFESSPATPRGRARADLAVLFAHVGLASPDLDARLLVCAACGIDHAGLIRDPDLPLGATDSATLAALAARRLAREPVSRILGRREFWGLDLDVSPDVLDPRPETEGLVGAAIDAIGGRRDAALRILDLGTGSGAILAALLGELPGAFGIGVDRSFGACAVARKNLSGLGFEDRSAVVRDDWTAALAGKFDLIVSNPPYIATDDLDGLDPEVRNHDPRVALDGGGDGYAPYRAIVPALPGLLAAEGIAAFECGTGQGETIAGLMRAAGLRGVAVYRDLAGHERVVIGVAGQAPEPAENM